MSGNRSARVASAMTARMILEAGAVKYGAERPYFLASGWASPVYIDCQRLISFPRIRAALMDLASEIVLSEAGFEQFDTVAGVDSSGIAYAAWIAERLSLPLQYVRARPRGFGREAQIEGTLRAGARVLLVDDIASDGRTTIELCRALRAMQARVDHVLVMFFYDVFSEARGLFEEAGIKLHYLATWRDVLACARERGYLEADAIAQAERFLAEPARWSLEHGGIGAYPRGGEMR
jgi:orotate phosphoribosyltransferase